MPKSKKSQVKEAAWRIFETTGQFPSRQAIMDEIGGGSARDVQAELNEWKSELADWVHHQRHRPELPDAVWQSMTGLWDVATKQAQQAALSALQEKEQALIEREQAAKEAVSHAKAELSSTVADRDRMSAKVEQLTAMLDDRKAECDKLRDSLNESQRAEALAQLKATDCEALATRLQRDLDANREAHRKEVDALRQSQAAENDRWLKTIDAARQEARKARDQADAQAQRAEGLLAEIADARQEYALTLANLKSEIQTWSKRYETAVKAHNAQSSQWQRDQDALRMEITSLQSEISDLKDHLTVCQERRVSAEVERDAVLATVNKLGLAAKS